MFLCVPVCTSVCVCSSLPLYSSVLTPFPPSAPFRYISTFYIRRGIDFGSFKRDVLLFKTIALSQLFYCYFLPQKNAFQVDYVSIGMILSG